MAAARESSFLRRLLRKKLGLVGVCGVAFFVLLALVGPWLAPYDPAATSVDALSPPDWSHLMGTDAFGRDTFSRFLYGSRVSLFVGIASVAIGLCLGTLVGMLAGWAAGRPWDGLLMRLMDVVLAFPLLVLVPVITGIVGARGLRIGPIDLGPVALVAVAIGIVLIPLFARIARASVLAEVREDYVVAARSFGARRRDILLVNLLPNISAPLIVQAAFSFAISITVEAAVSYLGLGVQPPESSWGTMLADGRQYIILGAWWLVTFPSLGIALAVLTSNLLGDVLRDEMDPRARTKLSQEAGT
ncbi:ABC transporter permease [Dactylosporangium sucinum]|uniref:Dipeptide ABC transporter permease DppC n=1 Tax=Dactylosporangium sucinum TaxID=1424081 RepID=A0A917TYX0_9ACTN|nr:ABC transporter permease [Dactylosporangium sucinum]GGM45806.1 dipeptide ABC transporter permease DppC [Dactylosporangium sucinum]